jgi:methylenetetrahydrofolate reductase (NADPH)
MVFLGCRACSHCLLWETAAICPMSCPRGLRNGPCRGSTPDHCYVDSAKGCIWFHIFQRAEQQGCLERLLEVNPPDDDRRLGCESLLRTYRRWHRQNQGPCLRDLMTNRARFNADWETFHFKARQPDWWQGDGRYHPSAYTEPVSGLEARLRNGRFAVSAEVAPPMEPTGDRIARVAHFLKNCVDTANFTDNPLGVPRMSGLACALYSLDNDLEPVLQLQTRHRSRYDYEAEAAGAAIVGVRNIVCLSDDTGRLGPGPTPRPELNDLDAVQALWMLRRLRDEEVNVDGEPVEHPPQYLLGATVAPYAALPRYEAILTEKKINAGAQFLQTSPVFDLARFAEWLEALDQRNLLGKAYLMPTVALLKSLRHARFMANEVPGIYLPPPLLARMEDAADPREEGIQIALELIAGLKGMPGIHGLHILAPGQEEAVPCLVKESGVRDFVPGEATSGDGRNAHLSSSQSTDLPRSGLDNFSGTEYNRNPNL